jgi:hypothetical protein
VININQPHFTVVNLMYSPATEVGFEQVTEHFLCLILYGARIFLGILVFRGLQSGAD